MRKSSYIDLWVSSEISHNQLYHEYHSGTKETIYRYINKLYEPAENYAE